MKPARFNYARPDTVDEAISLLAEYGGDAKLLAGGQSLVPMLNFRLARPAVLVDIGRIAGLGGIERRNGHVAIGAAVTQAEAERSSVAAACPLIGQALKYVGHPQIRARGTVCGSLAHADPAAELAAVALATGAAFVLRGPDGERNVAAAEFFLGPWMTTAAPTELLVEVHMPVLGGARTTFVELARRGGDFAVAGLAVAVTLDPATGTIAAARLGAIGVGMRAVRLPNAEQQLVGAAPSDAVFAAAAAAAAAEVTPLADRVKGDAEYRRQVLSTLCVRALTEVTR